MDDSPSIPHDTIPTMEAVGALTRVLADATPERRRAIIDAVQRILHAHSPQAHHPIDRVLWVPLEQVDPNDYNPNSVARTEMALLATSIRHDGYTQPIVTIYDPDTDRYTIVDGFHRYFTMRTDQAIFNATGGMLPIVVIDKDPNDRMASTIRHNRARGKHSITGMSNMVFQLLDNGWEDHAICNELGMSPEELLRLKHITGFSKLFADVEYRRSWVTGRQIRIAKEYAATHSEEDTT